MSAFPERATKAEISRLTEALFDEAQMKAAPGFYEAVLFARNDRWLPVIVERPRAAAVRAGE